MSALRLTFSVDRCFDGLFYRPSELVDSGVKRHNLHSYSLCPLRKAASLILVCNESIKPGVSHLLGMYNPIAIIRSVSFAVVYSFKRMFCRRSTSHVSIEHSKVIPCWTYRDTSFTVVSIGRVRRVVTALLHISPRKPLRGLSHAMSGSSSIIFNRNTPARLGVSITQRCGSRDDGAAAGALTLPHYNSGLNANWSYCGEPAKYLPSDVNGLTRKWYSSVSHFVTRFNIVIRGRLLSQPVLHYNMGGVPFLPA